MITIERQAALNKEISSSESYSGVISALKKVAVEFGFRHVTLLASPDPDDILLAPLIVETSWSRDYVREFDRQRLMRRCPLGPLLLGSALPVSWSIDAADTHNLAFDPQTLALLRIYDLVCTAAMPLHSVDGNRFILRFDGTRQPLAQAELNELGMIALHAFDVFDRLRRHEPRAIAPPLTARELEVVRWTSQGKTSNEIGNILSLSDHTINAYLTNAIRKLDCVNRTQLVAKAIRLKLIA
ncbi:response regulator transcription factor [Neorhizobium sp. NPDC001467]|uniref:response regulator transcription factor n=1 Tax=Neorhizobium sp. NPDC001467 TaxID=3390595 RepID=UPI003D021E23